MRKKFSASLIVCSIWMVSIQGAGAVMENPYQSPRFEEDWSEVQPLSSDPWYKWFKHINVSADDWIWLSVGGSARLRVENWANFNFSPQNDDTFILHRVFGHGDLHIGDSLRLFLEGKAVNSTDRDLPGGKRTTDVDALDFQNAFGEVMLKGVDSQSGLRVGRQELKFGREKLISPLPWANSKRSFDGVRALWESGIHQLSAFYTRPVLIRRYDSNSSNDDISLWGLYGSINYLGQDRGWDYYLLNHHQTSSDQDRYTPGLRVWGPISENLTYDTEIAFQFGEMRAAGRSLDIQAAMASGEIGYKLIDRMWNPILVARADFATGDDDPNDGDTETFHQLYPLGHQYLGYIDTVGRQNIAAFALGVKNQPIPEKLSFETFFHLFARASSSDGLYNASGDLIRPGNLTNDKEIGQELDLVLKWTPCASFDWLIGYSHFFAGSFIEKTTPAADSDIRFFTTAVEARF